MSGTEHNEESLVKGTNLEDCSWYSIISFKEWIILHSRDIIVCVSISKSKSSFIPVYLFQH